MLLFVILKKKGGSLELVHCLLQKGEKIRNFRKIFSAACIVCIVVFIFIFVCCHYFFLRKIKLNIQKRVAIWKLSSCSLRWVPVLLIRSTVLHVALLLFVMHHTYELLCFMQFELTLSLSLFGWFCAHFIRTVIWKSSSFWLPMAPLILIEPSSGHLR